MGEDASPLVVHGPRTVSLHATSRPKVDVAKELTSISISNRARHSTIYLQVHSQSFRLNHLVQFTKDPLAPIIEKVEPKGEHEHVSTGLNMQRSGQRSPRSRTKWSSAVPRASNMDRPVPFHVKHSHRGAREDSCFICRHEPSSPHSGVLHTVVPNIQALS